MPNVRYVLFFCFIVVIYFGTPFSARSQTIYFYSAESNINNFSFLKIETDKYLSQFGPFKFQPFKDLQTFEKFVTSENTGLCLLSSWHFEKLGSLRNLFPLLVGITDGKSTQRLILSTNKTITSIDELDGARIATAGSEEYSQMVLERMIGQKYGETLNTLEILAVPKDIDALMAVGLGIVQAAITTESNLIKFKQIDLVQYGRLNQLAASKEVGLPIIASLEPRDRYAKKLTNIFERMTKDPDGVRILQMLGLDGFKKIEK